ncbi:hypothetical protein [Desulfobacula phenolica]|nr:hypothetical protein [Desulfobacula phenolica]
MTTSAMTFDISSSSPPYFPRLVIFATNKLIFSFNKDQPKKHLNYYFDI